MTVWPVWPYFCYVTRLLLLCDWPYLCYVTGTDKKLALFYGD